MDRLANLIDIRILLEDWFLYIIDYNMEMLCYGNLCYIM